MSDKKEKQPEEKACSAALSKGKGINLRVLTETELINTIMENSQDTIYFKDRESRFIFNSRAHANQVNLSDPREMIGKSDFDYYPRSFAESARRDEEEIMATGTPICGRVERWEKDDGEVVWFSASKYPLYDDNGNIIGTWGTTRNITDLKNTERELEHVNKEYEILNNKLKELSVVDELSGLYNRRHFYETLTKTMKIFSRVRGRGYSSTFSLILMDIDDFKNINDNFGHLVGDLAIRHVATLLKQNTRLSDYVFRYGGDEFAIVLPDTDEKGSKELANRLRKIVMENPLENEKRKIELTLSLGTATFRDQVDSIQIVQDADTNLYDAKNSGKNCVR